MPTHEVDHLSEMTRNFISGALRIRQGWFKLELRVGGLVSVSTAVNNNWQQTNFSLRCLMRKAQPLHRPCGVRWVQTLVGYDYLFA